MAEQPNGSILGTCPACGNKVSMYAPSCPSCGHPFPAQAQQLAKKTWSPGIAALLSLVFPGAGQIYKGQVAAGLLWFFFVIGGYFMFIIPGLVLHIVCIFAAATSEPK